jgi:hypothetical protein
MSSVLEYRLTGGAANADPNASLGGDMSSEQLSGTALNNLFANVRPPDIESGDSVRYRAIELYNNGDAEARNVEFYFLDTPNSESIVAVWLDVTGTQTIGDEETEPTGASGNWTTPLVGSKLSLDNLAVSAGHRLWIRRTVDQDADNINDDLAEMHCWAS